MLQIQSPCYKILVLGHYIVQNDKVRFTGLDFLYSAYKAEEEEDVEDTDPAPREDPAPTITTVKDQEMVQRDILFH